MNKKVNIILKMWHDHFENEQHQYSEFEKSDIEYFVGCLLYNHFSFAKAVDTMKTMDLSYDFISECGNEYDEILEIINSINFDNELDSLEFLQEFIRESRLKYTTDELYLINRLGNHVDEMAKRYNTGESTKGVEFTPPKTRSKNPLDNK